MRKRLVRLAGLFLAVGLILPGLLQTSYAVADNQNIRIGLAYGSNAMPGANLLNSTGTGYRLGYYDSSLDFHTLGTTTKTAISVVKTQNVYFTPLPDGFSGYTDETISAVGVGCYHIQLPGTYATFEEAATAAVSSGVLEAFPAWIQGTYYVRTGAYLDAVSAEAGRAALGIEGTSIVGTSPGGVSVVETGNSQVLFQFDGGSELALGVLPGLDDSVKTLTWFKGRKYYGGFRFERRGGDNLTVVNILNLEDYVDCVISQEMSSSWPLEALKAQASCARTYAARIRRHTSDGFDLCYSTHCQAYPGAGQIGENTTRAAQETAGKYIWYDGKLAETYYTSSDGGATEDVRNVWNSNTNLPYLAGVTDPYEASVAHQIPNYNWTASFTASDLEQKLRSSGRNCGRIVDFRVSEVTPLGNVRSITLRDDQGKSWTFYGDNVRNFLGVRSIRFTVAGGGGEGIFVSGAETPLSDLSGLYSIGGDGTVAEIPPSPHVITDTGVEPLGSGSGDSYTVSGTGWGHNVGMSQWGAYAMAKQGFTYDEILKFYYTGVDVK